ncbi:acyltransferase [Marinilabilia sp.]|uniref:acyltransferase n=1 Tax=Marinilabilia sp. TaxID=2021252 RepID=UPI0025C2D26A|nr:acyltransferase [Marinilabilia sp.]
MSTSTSFYSSNELSTLGFKALGNNVLISRFARFYGIENMEIGSNVRIDDFCILSGKIKLGSYIHISAYCALYGQYGIELEDYTGLSPRCTLFSASDDFSGEHMISPMVPKNLTNVQGGKLTLERFTQVGANTIILPNVTLSEGSVIGAMSLVKQNTKAWMVYAGVPAKFIKHRQNNILKLFNKDKL